MGPLTPFALVLVAIAAPARAESVDTWQPYIAEASARFGVPVPWIERVMRAESGGRTLWNGHPTISRAGAMGLMQLMPATWAEMRNRLALGADPYDPRDNIIAGTAYLRLMYDRFGYPGCIAAYNAGPRRYAENLAGKRRLPVETIAYLAQVAPGSIAPARGTDPLPKPTIFVRQTVAAYHPVARPINVLFYTLSTTANPAR